MWQQPVDAGAISERGRKGAAEEKARQLQATLRDRGCKEDFTPNPTLLLEGQVRAVGNVDGCGVDGAVDDGAGLHARAQ